jgi:hypothetical protein
MDLEGITPEEEFPGEAESYSSSMDMPPGMLEWIQEKVRTGEIQLQAPESQPEEGAAGRFAATSEDTRQLWMGSRLNWVNSSGKTFVEVLHDRVSNRRDGESHRQIIDSINTADFHAPED